MTRKEIQWLAEEMRARHVDPEGKLFSYTIPMHPDWPGILKHGRMEPEEFELLPDKFMNAINALYPIDTLDCVTDRYSETAPWNRRDTI